MGDMTREELAAMTDQELLAYEREHHGDPYMTLAKARDAAGGPAVLASGGGQGEGGPGGPGGGAASPARSRQPAGMRV
jgi:hypothetical protein